MHNHRAPASFNPALHPAPFGFAPLNISYPSHHTAFDKPQDQNATNGKAFDHLQPSEAGSLCDALSHSALPG